MEAHAHKIYDVTVLPAGLEMFVMKVLAAIIIINLWYDDTYHYTRPCDAAVCHPPCKNGGNCTQPGYCTCESNWEGVRCETRKSAYLNFLALPLLPFLVNSQLGVHLHARMVVTAMSQEVVTALQDGLESDAKKVYILLLI